jgi:aryl-alcohol dehydrogenase-like predicted oxidoreductase
MKRLASLRVSPLCLGGNVFGWTADKESSEQILDAFVAGGGNFIDTADVYSAWVPGHPGGESERIIGGWLQKRGRHSDLVIATKVAKHPTHRGLRPSNLRICLDGSRRRLGIDVIDLYYAHEDDLAVPVAEWVGAFDAMVREGSIRHYGLSNFSAERTAEVLAVAEAEGLAKPVALQPEYNLVHRHDVETGGLAELAATHGLGLVPYFGLAAGFLTGKYRPGDQIHGARAARVKHVATAEGFAVVEELVDIADELGVEPATVALAWVAGRTGVTAPIASASTPEQVAALLAATELKLSRTQTSRLKKVSAPFV